MNVLKLTYHEIHDDPRVMKEARILRDAGCSVTILCDNRKNDRYYERSENIDIFRQDFNRRSDLSETALAEFDFLNSSKDEAVLRLLPLALHYQALRHISKTHRFLLKRCDKDHYKRSKGVSRILRKGEYLAVRGILTLYSTLFKTDVLPPEAEWRIIRRLYSAHGLVSAVCLKDFTPHQRPNFIHAHDIYTLPAGIVLARKFNAKLIYDAHEYEPARVVDNELENSFALDLENDCLAECDAVVTVSKSIADLYAKRFHRKAPILFFNTPELNTTSAQNADIRRASNLDRNTPLIAFTGGISGPNRGLDKVAEALVSLPEFHLAILGPRHEKHDKWLMDRAKKLKVSSRVHLLEPVNAVNVVAAVKSADLAIISPQDASLNYRYSMPNKLFEAAFSGIPVCVSNLPDMREFVEDFSIGRTMDQTDPRSIASAILEVYENKDKYRPSDKDKQRLVQEYGWDAQKARLVSLYADLAHDG